VGCDPGQGFLKEILYQAQMETTRDIF
jgi:hypothetical protein